MSKKSTELLEEFKKKINKIREHQELEWNWLKRSCPNRRRRKASDNSWEHGCQVCNESPANEKGYFYYCHFSNCPYT